MAPHQVLVVGGGLTGAAAARKLSHLLPPDSSIVVWEALDVLGGRFHTERTASSGACDMGAQYVTVTDDEAVADDNKPLFMELITAGVLTPLNGRIQGGRAADGGGANYIAPSGLSSIVSHLFTSAGLEPTRMRRAISLRQAAPNKGLAWEVSSADGHFDSFDGVLLTQPLPELLELLDTGDAAKWLTDTPTSPDPVSKGPVVDAVSGLSRAALTSVQYSSRYALTLWFSPLDAPTFSKEIDWVARYVQKEEDDAIVYLGHDSAKRGQPADDPNVDVSLIVHTSVPYGIQKLKAQATEEAVSSDLLTRVQKLLPWLPPPRSSVLRTWRVSQVRYPLTLPSRGVQGEPTACWSLSPTEAAGVAPPLILAGDAFSPLGSRFDGCLQSGESAAATMARALVHGAGD